MLPYVLQGCVEAVVDTISEQIGVIAGVSIAIAVLLVRYEPVCHIWVEIFRGEDLLNTNHSSFSK